MPLGDRHLVPGTRGIAARSDRSHSRRRLTGAIVCALILLAGSCGKGVEKVVTLTFSNDKPDTVVISTSTNLGKTEAGSAEEAAVERERTALLNGSDDWAVRFAMAEPEVERVTMQRRNKQLERVERTGEIPVANLQRFFYDTTLTLDVTNGEGWRELRIHAGASNRATPAQKRRVNDLLNRFSEHAVRYYAATHALYDYLDSNDARAEILFLEVGNRLMPKEKRVDDSAVQLSDTEDKLVSRLVDSIEALVDEDRGGSANLDLEFDQTFNPFPAEFHVVVPGATFIVEGFEPTKEGGLIVKPKGVFDAIQELEGKWISPDPLVQMLRAGEKPDVAALAAKLAPLPRTSTDVVRTDEVRDALIREMTPPENYRVRWNSAVSNRKDERRRD